MWFLLFYSPNPRNKVPIIGLLFSQLQGYMSGIQEIFTFSASKPTLVISLHLNNENSSSIH